MRLSLGKRNRVIASIMLVAFALRGLIPAGFMPASDRPFSLEICWEGLPAGVLAHVGPSRQGPHHHGSPSQSEHCVFGAGCSAGPIPHLPLPGDFSSAQQLIAVVFVSIAGAVHLVHLPQPRAPPGQLS